MLVGWCALIFFFSAQPHLTIVDRDTLDFVLRKLAHMSEFGVLLLLASMTFRQEGASARRAAWLALAATVAYAGLDEWHQTFVAGRNGNIVDVLIDSSGALIAFGLASHRRARMAAA